MIRKIAVYDEFNDSFRDLDELNYNDDLVVGTIFLRREAINVLKRYFVICGYILIGGNGELFPIDIRQEEIAILEGTYNCMPSEAKKELIEYNVTQKPRMIWSKFFFQWQFMGDWSVFEKHGSFIEMMSNIVGDEEKLNEVESKKYNLYMPITYEELCHFVNNVSKLFSTDFYRETYIEEVKYIMDSLLKGYRVNMSTSEIETYCFQICTIINNEWVKNNG